MIFLHLWSATWKQAFQIRFLNISKSMFLRSNPLRKENFLRGYDIFFRDSCSFPYTEKVSDHFVEKIRHDSTTLRRLKSEKKNGSQKISSFVIKKP